MSFIHEKILSHIDKLATDLTEATQCLVRVPSENPPGDTAAVADTVVKLIQSHVPSAAIKTYNPGPGIHNVVAIVNGSKPGKRLVFSGHLDTYPAGDGALWTVPPFDGKISEDGLRLYGRGVSDMKGGIAASIIASRVLAQLSNEWPGEIVLAFAGDEETMGSLGSEYLLDHTEYAQCDAMICGDAGSPLVVRAGEKGFIWVELRSTGKAAHGAHVHRGDNAIDKLVRALLALKQLESLKIDDGPISEVINGAKSVSEVFGGKGEAEILRKLTVNIGKINGGTSTNLVPDEASASADIRIPIGLSVGFVADELQRRLTGLAEIRIVRTSEPSWTAPQESIVRHTLNATQSIVGNHAVVNMRVGSSDSRLFRKRNIPSVVTGLTPYNMGGPDEYVLIKELAQVSKIHALAAFGFLLEDGI